MPDYNSITWTAGSLTSLFFFNRIKNAIMIELKNDIYTEDEWNIKALRFLKHRRKVAFIGLIQLHHTIVCLLSKH